MEEDRLRAIVSLVLGIGFLVASYIATWQHMWKEGLTSFVVSCIAVRSYGKLTQSERAD